MAWDKGHLPLGSDWTLEVRVFDRHDSVLPRIKTGVYSETAELSFPSTASMGVHRFRALPYDSRIFLVNALIAP